MKLKQQIDKQKLPKHVAVIMDGNGRWAKKRGMSRVFGHKNAVKAVRETIELGVELKINTVTLYCFSTENWKRPKVEINTLMDLIVDIAKREYDNIQKQKICVKIIGDITPLPKRARIALEEMAVDTANNDGMKVALCINYGSRTEITSMVQKIAQKVAKGKINATNIEMSHVEEHLQTKELPPLDLLIRTSGEKRISNFMLWQLAYSELYFSDVFWPDFRKEEFCKALLFYQNRERRFGKTSEQIDA